MDNGFTFGDRATWDFPIMKVEKYPSSRAAARRYQTYPIPGRNGDLHVDEGSFQNYKQSYECYYHTEQLTNEMAHAVKGWLLGTPGYQRLIDVYDPSHYRLAAVLEEFEIKNILNAYGRFTVTFDCDPRSFLLSGDEPILFSQAGILLNPTVYTAKPMVKVTGTGEGTISINGITVQINKISGLMILDCENENAYSMSANAQVNENANIYALEFPELSPGENSIAFSGDVATVEIIPRWWEL